MHWLKQSILILLPIALLSFGACAHAGARSSRPAPPDANPPLALKASINNDTISLDDETDASSPPIPIISPNKRTIAHSSPLTPTIRFIEQSGGFDVRITYTNNSSQPQPLGSITLGGIRMGQNITARDFRYDSSTLELDHNNKNFFGPGRSYPEELYSPVVVMNDNQYTIGASLLYPVLEYKTSVRTQLRSPGGIYQTGGRNWEIDFKLQGTIPPAQTRRFILAVRVTKDNNQWVRTLLPYRDYFQSNYGPVKYTRDPRPVRGFTLTQRADLSAANPRGYSNPNRRPDTKGWRAWANVFRASPSAGFNRIMVWTPTGLQRQHDELNYPFLFMSPMKQIPAMQQSLPDLASASSAVDIGFWWGRSQQVTNYWDAPTAQVLDPDNPDHVARAFAELDIAVELGATLIGLDAFTKMPVWDAHRWLLAMQDRAPAVTFIIEPRAPDILHRLAPTWLDHMLISQSNIIADFLNPGHETWVGIRYDIIERRIGRTLTNTEKNSRVALYADMGYIPMSFSHVTLNQQYRAAESWKQTLPADLQPKPASNALPTSTVERQGNQLVVNRVQTNTSQTAAARDPAMVRSFYRDLQSQRTLAPTVTILQSQGSRVGVQTVTKQSRRISHPIFVVRKQNQAVSAWVPTKRELEDLKRRIEQYRILVASGNN